MPDIDKITIRGTEYDVVDNSSGYTSFSCVPSFNTGVTVGIMNFNGVTYTIYAPQSTESGTLSIGVVDNELVMEHLQLD